MLLSDRMLAVVELVEPCETMADIGCDHGYVAMELIRRHTCKHVIAMDINPGPLKRAKNNIREYGMQEYIETRLSNGTEAISQGEAQGIICAGMGGRLILSILEEGRGLIRDMKQVILQPQSEIDEVRAYLRDNGFLIDKEDIVCEEGKYYPMMRALPGAFGKQEKQMAGSLEQKCKDNDMYINHKTVIDEPPGISETAKEETVKLTRIHDTYGPYLLEKSHPILKRYLLREKGNFESIRSNLMSREQITARQQHRISELDEKLSDIVFCLYNYF